MKGSPLLIIVSGAPGSGKTTLSRRLSTELALPLLAKDDIKELLFERTPDGDRAWSEQLGKIAIAMMYCGAEKFLANNQHVIIESAFTQSFSRSDVESLIGITGARCIELHCSLPYSERQKRWSERARTTRHPRHLDNPDHIISERTDSKVGIGRMIEVDTSVPAEQYEQNYAMVTGVLRKELQNDRS